MPQKPKPLIEQKKISDLIPDAKNANKGTVRGLSMLDDSLSEVGLGRSIVTDRHGNIIGGNKTTERAIDRGFEDAIVVHTEGDKLVVVQRDDLDLTDAAPNNPARKLAYYDNRAGEVSLQWDSDQLQADLDAGFEFSKLFDEAELSVLFAPEATPPDGFPEYGEDIDTEHECPKCGYKWSGQAH